uniref:Secreted protein n=1 Tax=Strongyloides stercoralis TaxID=6248 RepID=A0A0K0EGM5_STRER
MKLAFINSFSSIHLIIFLVLLLTFEETLGYPMGHQRRGGRNRRHSGSQRGLSVQYRGTSPPPPMRSGGGRQNGINRRGG